MVGLKAGWRGRSFFPTSPSKAGNTVKEAKSTLRLPTVANKPRLKTPRWPEIIKLPNPTVVVKAARATPLAVLAGRVMTRVDSSNCQRTRMIIPNSMPYPKIKGRKRTLA